MIWHNLLCDLCDSVFLGVQQQENVSKEQTIAWNSKHKGTEDTERLVAFSEKCPKNPLFCPSVPYLAWHGWGFGSATGLGFIITGV